MGSGANLIADLETDFGRRVIRKNYSTENSRDQNVENKYSDLITEVDKISSSKTGNKSAKLSKMPPCTLDDFEVICSIGAGTYGTCKKIRRKKDGKILAWKEMDYGSMTESEKQMLVSEVNLLRELKHPHIVRYHDRIIDRGKTTIYIIMEYCDGGDLASTISQNKKKGTYVDEEFVWKIFIQMTSALEECHRRKDGKAVLHRDLKPANIFLDCDKNVKLGDFGLARVLNHETSFAKTYVGTPYYMSPELVNNMSYNEKSDVWSMGCMLYELCALHPPFIAGNQIELNKKICLGDFKRIPLQYSENLNTLLAKMLRVEVHKRPSIKDLLNEPVVLRKRSTLERRQSSGSNSPSADKSEALQQWEEELKARERKLDLMEKEIESRERNISLREKLLEERIKKYEEKLKNAETYKNEYRRKYSLDNLIKPAAGDTVSDSTDDGLASCLSRGKKDPDTPKKKVTFDMYSKENLRQKQKMNDFINNYDTELDSYDNLYVQELAKRRELKDRLFKAREKAMEIRSYDVDTRPKSRNLLHFR